LTGAIVPGAIKNARCLQRVFFVQSDFRRLLDGQMELF
jgi:hypothetical protein